MKIVIPPSRRYSEPEVRKIVHGSDRTLLDEIEIWANVAYCQEQIDRSKGKMRSAGAGRDDYYHAGRLELLEELRAKVAAWRTRDWLHETRRICAGEPAQEVSGDDVPHLFLREIRESLNILVPQDTQRVNALKVQQILQRRGFRRIADVPSTDFKSAVCEAEPAFVVNRYGGLEWASAM